MSLTYGSPMEAADRRIIELLRGDGRMSYTDLGKAGGLSTSAVHQRVRRLEERGVITGYAATIDPTALGTPLTAFVSPAHRGEFATLLRFAACKRTEVIEEAARRLAASAR